MARPEDYGEFLRQNSQLFDMMPSIYAYKDVNSRFIFCNRTMIDYVGAPSNDSLYAKCDYDLMWSDYADLYRAHEIETLNNKVSVKLYPSVNIDGNEVLIMCHRIPHKVNSKAVGIISQAYEVKDRSLMELGNLINQKDHRHKNERVYTLNEEVDSSVHLTNRERECLFYCIRGKTAKMIGEVLCLSRRTVESYLEDLKLKFHCKSKSELIEKAISLGYLYDIPLSLIKRNSNEFQELI